MVDIDGIDGNQNETILREWKQKDNERSILFVRLDGSASPNCMLINFVPLRILKNDGWIVLRPDTALAEVRRKVGVLE